MKYIKLVLVGYKRLLLKNINHFEITPTTPIQLILGTNGSGKSSIIKELSPLPASSSDFIKGGYKEITIEMGGDTYVLRNSFGDKEVHTFEMNGVNLNDGRKITEQTKLAKEKFNYTFEMHDLNTGQIKFTSMGAMVRRHWLTKFSNTDYEYAIRVFNKVAERHRDIAGTIKTLKKRLVAETEKIISAEEQATIEKDVEELHRALTHLLEVRKPLDREPNDCERDLNNQVSMLEDLSKQLIHIKSKLHDYGFQSDEDIEAAIRDSQVLYRTTAQMSEVVYVEHNQVNESIKALKQTNEVGLKELTTKLHELTDKLNRLAATKELFTNIHSAPENALSALDAVTTQLLELVTVLPINTNLYYSRETVTKLTTDLQTLTESKETMVNNLNKYVLEKKHQEVHKDSIETVCPKCKHHWHVGYDQNKYEQLCIDIEKLSSSIADVEKKIDTTLVALEDIRLYFATYKHITNIFASWTILNPLWDFIKEETTLLNNPSRVEYLIAKYRDSLLTDVQYFDISNEIEQVKELMRLATVAGDQDLVSLENKKHLLESKIHEMSLVMNKAQADVRKFTNYKTQKNQINSLQAQIQQAIPKHDEVLSELVEAHRRNYFNQAIRVVQSNLSRKEMAISEIRGQRTIIADIENQIMLLEKDEEALALLVKELSPKEGLIAEGLFGFINVFTKQLNQLMESIFTYKFEVLPCNLEDEDKVELDYKFPVMISTNDTPIPDISKTSKGQREIIDLAFVIMGMKHAGLSESPLMLDEFGANLDSTHRNNATNMVKNLMEKHSFTQLFMVNHYDTIYGAFTNAQTTVLCDENVVIPRGCTYNQHVVIK